MRIETAPPEWLRAVVEAVCVALEINPAMLPSDPDLAGEKIAEAITEASEDVDDDGWPIGAAGGKGDDEPESELTPMNPDRMKAMLNTLRDTLRRFDAATQSVEDAKEAVNEEIELIEEALKEKP